MASDQTARDKINPWSDGLRSKWTLSTISCAGNFANVSSALGGTSYQTNLRSLPRLTCNPVLGVPNKLFSDQIIFECTSRHRALDFAYNQSRMRLNLFLIRPFQTELTFDETGSRPLPRILFARKILQTK